MARPHGLRGEVVVELITNRAERFSPGAHLEGPCGALTVVSSRPERRSGGRDRLVVLFAGVTGRDGAERLRGAVLRGAPLVDPDALWVHELIGSAVLDTGGRALGKVTAVEANPASDLLVVDGDVLVPLRFVVERLPGVVTVELPDGLLDLQRGSSGGE